MKNKILILAITLFLYSSIGYAQINFEHGTWAEVKAKAKKENKYIMVDSYTTWCGPCKWMSENTFTDAEVGKFFNEKYVNYKLDMEKKGDGLDFARNYKIRSYPTIVFFNPQGEIVHKFAGATEPEGFLRLGKDALNPEKQVFTLKRKYEAGERSPEFLRTYAYTLRNADEKYGKVAKLYIATQNKKDWTSKENWEFIQTFINEEDSEIFQYVLENKEIYQKIDKEAVNYYIAEIIVFNNRPRTIKDIDEIAKQLQSILGADAEQFILGLKVEFYGAEKEDLDNLIKYGSQYYEKYVNDWDQLNEVAWWVFEKTKEKKYLEQALLWAKKSVGIEENWYNTDTYAHLLFNLGKLKEAKVWAEKSVKIGKKAGENVIGTEMLLKKIKEKLK